MLNFAPQKEITLRPYQDETIGELRNGVRAGKRRQILCAPTGAGKTVMAASLLKQADQKGAYALFMVDRVALVDQTSATLDEYGIRHGIIQGINSRYAPHENVQVCSIQTLARRSLPRDPSLIIYDEAHVQYKAILEYIDQHPEAVVIGLTATPFTAGMAEHWGGIVNARSTAQLIADGFLVAPKIYVARSPDEEEFSRNSFGEFSDESAASAGIQIIGDVVQEWTDKTNEHFGGPVKTIVFSPTVEHGRELCASFAAAGFNFQQISYLDRDDDARRQKIAEFRKPESEIHGLVSCGVLTKGFDVPDVRCIASGQRVLTDKGLVPIEKVTLGHKVWDGIEYVSHQGVIFKGYQDVIEYAGLIATADHEVHTEEGWRTLGDCAAQQIFITTTGFDECAVRIDEGYFTRGRVEAGWSLAARTFALRVHGLWKGVHSRYVAPSIQPSKARVSHLLSCSHAATKRGGAGLVGAEVQRNADSLHGRYAQGLAGLRWAWDRVSLLVSACLRAVGGGEPRLTETGPEHAIGSRGQQWALRGWKPSLGIEGAQLQQHSAWRLGGDDASVPHRTSRHPICGQDPAQPLRDGVDIRPGGEEISPAVRQAKRPVWDILQAGPRNRFTCEGLLVHNCGISCKPYRKSLSSHLQEIGRVMRRHPGKEFALWLDHSGNIERFAMDQYEFWENGADDLSTAQKRDTTPRERVKSEKEKIVCPECSGALLGNTCSVCGWERPARSNVVAVDGEMQAFDMDSIAMAARPGLRAECLKRPRSVWDAALSYCLSSTRNGEEHARRWAYGVWRGVYPEAKLPRGWYEASPRAADQNALALVEREIKRFRKNSRRSA